MRVHVCGVRGSTPLCGSEFLGIGGHTSCIAIAHDEGVPVLVLDAGTGVRRVSALLDGAPFRGTIVLGHLHWDHTQGLPFFKAGDRDDARVRLLLPEQDAGPGATHGTRPQDSEALLARAMGPPHFPITPSELRGDWTFESYGEGSFAAEGFTVTAREIPHKGGRTMGLRITDGRSTMAYLSDHAPQDLGLGPRGVGAHHAAAMALADGVDLLVHDAQYTADELPARGPFGHAAAEYALGLAEVAGAHQVLLFHHDPSRTDAEVEALERRLAAAAPVGVSVSAAREGCEIRLG